MPKTYTMCVDYLAQRGDRQEINFQPYIATVGDDEYTYDGGKKVITQAEKDRVRKTIDLPEMDGYTTPTPKLEINYDYIKQKAKEGGLKPESSYEYFAEHPYIYESKRLPVKIKHVFQDLYDPEKYGGMTEDSEPIIRDQ